jgi:hypothetical protein
MNNHIQKQNRNSHLQVIVVMSVRYNSWWFAFVLFVLKTAICVKINENGGWVGMKKETVVTRFKLDMLEFVWITGKIIINVTRTDLRVRACFSCFAVSLSTRRLWRGNEWYHKLGRREGTKLCEPFDLVEKTYRYIYPVFPNLFSVLLIFISFRQFNSETICITSDTFLPLSTMNSFLRSNNNLKNLYTSSIAAVTVL